MLEQFGGREIRPATFAATMPNSTVCSAWNFGLMPKTNEVDDLIRSTPTLHAMFPAMAGKWDGKATVNHWEAAVKVLGESAEDLIQYQPRGTCGGRAGSATYDLVQCILMASGTPAKFHRASHAYLYWQARKKYGMDHGNPNDDRQDGVASGAIPETMASKGGSTRDESGDMNGYGSGSDALACNWGAGRIDATLAAKLEGLAADNVITAWAPVSSAAELADGIAAGGIGIGSDGQGFTMTRDAQGFCRPTGTWQHYQVRLSVGVWDTRPGFGYFQSWSKGTPTGPRLLGHPGNCFGVDFSVQDQIIRNGEWAVVWGFPLFELQQGGRKIDWMF